MRKKPKSSVLNMIERDRHRVVAGVTQEAEWEQQEPNSGLARMFVIMLLIHVFVIGAIIIYDFVGGDTGPKASQVASPTPTVQATSTSTAAKVSPAPLPTPTPAPTTITTVVPPAPAAAPTVPADSLLPKTTAPAATPAAVTTPIVVAKAIPYEAPPHPTATPPVVAKTSEPAKPKATEDKPKATPDKSTAATSTTQPRPVMTPTAARKSLEKDKGSSSAPPTTVAKKKPDSDAPNPKSEIRNPKSSPTRGSTKYKVVKGDTIYSLARRYKTTEAAIMSANDIKKATGLAIGRTLTIPATK